MEYGKIEFHSSYVVKGWASNKRSPDEPVSIEVYQGQECVGKVAAGLYRGDLEREQSGGARHGFVFQIPPNYRDGSSYLFHFKFSGTGTELENSPIQVSSVDEDRFIPFRTTNLTGNKVLVLAPHPDDESLGCGGALSLHQRAGDHVKVVFLTDGAKANPDSTHTKEAYVHLRKREAEAACAILGISDCEFWRVPDRGLSSCEETKEKLVNLLTSYQPTLIYAPSPFEFHSDHRAAAELLWLAVRQMKLQAKLAFFENNRPVNINTLVDITSVIDQKVSACRAYASQLQNLPYIDCILGLNRYRALTVSSVCEYAEGFVVVDSQDVIRDQPHAFALRQYLQERKQDHTGPLVSIVIRTQDRLPLLKQALASVMAQTYSNLEVVVVNDGGEDVSGVLAEFESELRLQHIHLDHRRGRSAAANAGVEKATGKYINFLDDDDLLYPNHVEKLVKYLENAGAQIAYSDCEICYYAWDGQHFRPTQEREVFAGGDFDRERLFHSNNIPIMTAMFSKRLWERAGHFDESLEYLEDWDFWIRVARHAEFKLLPGVTAEYRVFSREAWQQREQNQPRAALKVYQKHAYYWTLERVYENLTVARGSAEAYKKQLAETRESLATLSSLSLDLTVAKERAEGYKKELAETRESLATLSSLNLDVTVAKERAEGYKKELAETRESLGRLSRPSLKAITLLFALWLEKTMRRIGNRLPG